MLDFPRWKYFLIVLIVLVSALYALPNVYPQDPALQIAANRDGTIDDSLATKVRGLLEAAKIPYASVAKEGKDLIVRLADTDQQGRAADIVRPELGEAYTVALNLAPTVPAWLTALGAKPMTLGLDLQGGVHFLMEVDQAAAREKRENAYVEEVQVLLKDNDVFYTGVGRDANGIVINLRADADRGKATSLLARDLPRLTVVPDSADGTLRVQLLPDEIKKIADDAIEQNIISLRNRVASLAEPVIQRQGSNRIIVELPGIQDVAQAKRLLGGTATLEWRAVTEGNPLTAQQTGVIPPDSRLYFRRSETPGVKGQPILLSKRVIVSGDQLIDAIPGIDPGTGQPDVSIKLDSAGGKRMLKHTLDNVGKLMAIVYIERTPTTSRDPVTNLEVRSSTVREEVINAATIQGVFGANFHTTGLEPAESKQLSAQIKAGALAAPMEFVEERVVGPSLGRKNVESGIKAVLYS
ncbi:MAG: SecDF P1 head subdomain-containing protein, partial [Arenimonas sp.]